MKTKLEMAHEWAIELLRAGDSSDDVISCAWRYADAMQAEAEKRSVYGANWDEELRETHKNRSEFKMYPEYDASINYPPDAWVMYKGEKRLAVSIDIKKEWQPDWSQAPEWANWWSVDENGTANFSGKKPHIDGRQWVYYSAASESSCHIEAPSFGYTGNWRESLRKRPS